MDGISIEILYKNGELVTAITRGDGVQGEVITPNVIRMQGVNQKLPISYTGSIHGEIILRSPDYNTLNEICAVHGKKQFKTLRNAASGISRKQDGEFSEYCTVVYYDCTGNFKTVKERFDFLEMDLNLKTARIDSAVTLDDVISCHEDYEDSIRASLDYEIDGIVIEIDDMKLKESRGLLNNNPKGAIAFKFGNVKKETILKDIEWHVGSSGGRITPVAVLEPVNIGGVTVQKASLHNVEIFESLHLRYGDIVIVSRRNDVIPGIEGVKKSIGKTACKVISTCPSCGETVRRDGKFLICSNEECDGKAIGNLKKWIKALDIKGIGDGIIESLYEHEILKDPADFYRITVESIQNIEGFGKRSAEKIIKVLNDKKDIPLREFIGGLNFANFGRRMTDVLVENSYDTFDKVCQMNLDDLVKLKGIEAVTAQCFIDGLVKREETIQNLFDVGITIQPPYKMEKKIMNTDSKMAGKEFIFTGKIERVDADGTRYTRTMLQQIVMENGGVAPSSISKKTDYLVQADKNSQSSKTKKAWAFDVEIISEAEFFEMAGM